MRGGIGIRKRQFPFFASAAITENSVIIGGRDKMVHALSLDTGEPDVDLHR